ncbi:MAG: hypothetical protein QUS08_04355 [Methanothrix sp.]|nr:hypothetical protein [Methanothrix sp.]
MMAPVRLFGSIGLALLGIALLLMISPSALADVKVEGWRDLSYEYRITNIGDFPDYVFLASSAIWGFEYTTLINSSGRFGGGYKLDQFVVHAVRASEFDQERFLSQEDERGTFNCTGYCQSIEGLVTSNLTLPRSTSVEEILPLERIEVLLEVEGITERGLDISRRAMLYYYQNGTVQELLPD